MLRLIRRAFIYAQATEPPGCECTSLRQDIRELRAEVRVLSELVSRVLEEKTPPGGTRLGAVR